MSSIIIIVTKSNVTVHKDGNKVSSLKKCIILNSIIPHAMEFLVNGYAGLVSEYLNNVVGINLEELDYPKIFGETSTSIAHKFTVDDEVDSYLTIMKSPDLKDTRLIYVDIKFSVNAFRNFNRLYNITKHKSLGEKCFNSMFSKMGNISIKPIYKGE